MTLTLAQQQRMPTMVGSMVALVTPMMDNGDIDWVALDTLVEWHIQQKTNAIVAVGTTGESATLEMSEHAQVIERVIKVANKRVPIVAGTGANSTREAIELTQAAKNMGADAALLVCPYYNKPTQEGLYQHHKAIAEAVDIPQMLYNVPGRTGVDMQHDTVVRLAQVDGIFSIKEATGDLTRGKALIDALKGKIDVYSGDDATAPQLILLGAKGNISVTANILPHTMYQLCQHALNGDADAVKSLETQLALINQLMFCESNPIPVKYALWKMGKIQNAFRLPLTPLDAKYHDKLNDALTQLGLLA